MSLAFETTIEQSAQQASALLKAMGNEHRFMILCHLRLGEKCVGELTKVLCMRQAFISQHLARLRRDRLVKVRREGHEIFYSLAGQEAITMIKALYRIYGDD